MNDIDKITDSPAYGIDMALGSSMSVLSVMNAKHQSSFIKEMDAVIRKAFISKGIEPNLVLLKTDDFSIINIEGDPFDHYYYKYGTKEEVRIISIERLPEVNFSNSNDTGSITAFISSRYY